ncbi:MAG TPA: SdrD B-like domain-containing protein [Pseudonocardiaceae bacterium]|nr:SdrD B-like domain-containing protein [Pseudonocardiaceae bacterium]
MLIIRPRLGGALSAAFILSSSLVLAIPASADATPGYDCVVDTPYQGANPQLQPIQVCASFDKANYSSGDTVKATISVKNLGTAPAPRVTIWPMTITGTDHVTGNPQGPLITNGFGPTLAPGDTVVSEVDGYAADPASGTVTFSAPVYQFLGNGSGNAFGDPVSITSAVTAATGNYSGVVFADGNGNGSPDSGEGLAGVQVTLSGPFSGINGNSAQNYSATTDANGAFGLTGLPAGRYSASVANPAGWYVQPAHGGTVTVSAADTGPDRYEATPSPTPLTASMSFDQTSYHAGDTVNVTINLTNTSATTLRGVQAECDPAAQDGVLIGAGKGWNQLRNPGVTVLANHTLTLHLSEIIPVEEAGDITGKYEADCLFQPFVGYRANAPEASASATLLAPSVPTTTFKVNIVNDDPRNIGGTPGLHLLDPATRDIVAGGFFGFGTGATVAVAQGTWDIALGSSANGPFRLASGQACTLDTASIASGQTVDIHVVPVTQLAPPTPPTD